MKPGSIASLLGSPTIEAPISGPGVTVHRLGGDDDEPLPTAARPPIAAAPITTRPKDIDMKHGENAQLILDAITAAHPAMVSRTHLQKSTGLEPSQLSSAIYLLKKNGQIKTTGATSNVTYGLGNNQAADANLAQKTKRAKPARRTKTVKAGKDAGLRKAASGLVNQPGNESLDAKIFAAAAAATSGIPLGHAKPWSSAPIDKPRFGYFSDGSLQIECAGCIGHLTQSDLVALRDFTTTFEQAA